jgi:hypothetical protein
VTSSSMVTVRLCGVKNDYDFETTLTSAITVKGLIRTRRNRQTASSSPRKRVQYICNASNSTCAAKYDARLQAGMRLAHEDAPDLAGLF